LLQLLLAPARPDAGDDRTGALHRLAGPAPHRPGRRPGAAGFEIVRGHRDAQPVAVLIADLDHFKAINDAHGHQAGDVALLAAVAALAGGLRPYDQLGRFGGEEFTAVLPRTGPVEAARIAERLCRAVSRAPMLLADTPVEVSVSIGVAVLGEHGTDLTDWLAAADAALYRAKQTGRNRVAVAS
jgi:diguanylate cyclase (GGDEF)-like protein